MPQITRRSLFKAGLGAIGTLMAQKTMGQVCTTNLQTPEQPLGPFFPREGTPQQIIKKDPTPQLPIFLSNDNDLTSIKGLSTQAKGQVVNIEGQLTDPSCQPLSGAQIIIWQASESGRYNHNGDQDNHSFIHPVTGNIIDRELDENFQYWGKATTDQEGRYHFKTIIPGFYPANLNNGWYRPPHIHFLVMATGYENLVTQMYFQGDDIENNEFIKELNDKDPLLQNNNISNEERSNLLVNFKKDLQKNNELRGSFNIQLK